MIKVDQTKFGNKEGNCMQACIASLLELPLKDVPNFVQGQDWWPSFQWWLLPLGYSAVEIGLPPRQDWSDNKNMFNEGQICWAIGKSPRGDFKHAMLVKWKNGDWINFHDPHPDRTGLDGGIELIGFLVSINPVVRM